MNKFTNELELHKVRQILKRINDLADSMAALSDEELRAMTPALKERYAAGETLDALLPEAFAVCREASKRVLGMYPYDVQVMGAIVLHQGKIAEMKTGEGKTLISTMPLYLNALTGKSCFLITVNDYLAARDGEMMRPLYQWLGLTEAVGVPDVDGKPFTNAEKKIIYAADIVYTTNNALVFDYLFENLEASIENRYFRDFYYVIIDEADSVLLDAATNTLRVSGKPRMVTSMYEMSDYFVRSLHEGDDYAVEEQNVWLTPAGIEKAEKFFGNTHLFSSDSFGLVRTINLALRAHALFERDKKYLVLDDEIILLDSATGRVSPGTKLGSGLHQAIEVKEHVTRSENTRSIAAITFQDFFNMFPKKAGMTGTGSDDADEFRTHYYLDVVIIPTRKKVQRIDYPDQYYTTALAQITAALQEVIERHATGQPILLVTGSIRMSDIFSELLLKEGIPHNVLNAYNAAKEAEIIKEAGSLGAVTVATAMAGRGTDIKLTDQVKALGGLAVLGIGRMENIRLELQARGRAGRQGDPGMSRFYVSLDDEVVMQYGDPSLQRFRGNSREIHSPYLKRVIDDTMVFAEDAGRARRKMTAETGRSMRKQREIVYATRNRIMEDCNIDPAYYLDLEDRNIDDFLADHNEQPEMEDVKRYILDHIAYYVPTDFEQLDVRSPKMVKKYLHDLAEVQIMEKIRTFETEENIRKFFCQMTLQALDDAWIEEVDYLRQVRDVLRGRKYAQKNLNYEYHLAAAKSFDKMKKHVRETMLHNILQGSIIYTERGGIQIMYP